MAAAESRFYLSDQNRAYLQEVSLSHGKNSDRGRAPGHGGLERHSPRAMAGEKDPGGRYYQEDYDAELFAIMRGLHHLASRQGRAEHYVVSRTPRPSCEGFRMTPQVSERIWQCRSPTWPKPSTIRATLSRSGGYRDTEASRETSWQISTLRPRPSRRSTIEKETGGKKNKSPLSPEKGYRESNLAAEGGQ